MSLLVKPQQKQLGHRKSSKPLMERRRARINACLGQLRTLLTQAQITQPSRRSRLEKADILEMTVRHLKSITSHDKDATLWSLFRAGYNDCTRQIFRFLTIPDAHPLRSVFLHPLREELSVNTELVDGLSFHQHQLTGWPASGRCKMGKLGKSRVGYFHSTLNRTCLRDLQSQVRSVYTTSRPKLDAPVASSEMKTEQNAGPDGVEVWRPW